MFGASGSLSLWKVSESEGPSETCVVELHGGVLVVEADKGES